MRNLNINSRDLRRLRYWIRGVLCLLFLEIPLSVSAQSVPAVQQIGGGPGSEPMVMSAEMAAAQGVPVEGMPPGAATPVTPGQPEAGAAGNKPAAGAAETIKRPKEPKAPPDKKEFEVKPDEAGLVHFQFRDQAWPDILQ